MEPLDGILKQIKESFGFSEKKVAEDLGISRQKLNYWKGKGFPRKYEDGKKLIEYCYKLDIPEIIERLGPFKDDRDLEYVSTEHLSSLRSNRLETIATGICELLEKCERAGIPDLVVNVGSSVLEYINPNALVFEGTEPDEVPLVAPIETKLHAILVSAHMNRGRPGTLKDCTDSDLFLAESHANRLIKKLEIIDRNRSRFKSRFNGMQEMGNQLAELRAYAYQTKLVLRRIALTDRKSGFPRQVDNSYSDQAKHISKELHTLFHRANTLADETQSANLFKTNAHRDYVYAVTALPKFDIERLEDDENIGYLLNTTLIKELSEYGTNVPGDSRNCVLDAYLHATVINSRKRSEFLAKAEKQFDALSKYSKQLKEDPQSRGDSYHALSEVLWGRRQAWFLFLSDQKDKAIELLWRLHSVCETHSWHHQRREVEKQIVDTCTGKPFHIY